MHSEIHAIAQMHPLEGTRRAARSSAQALYREIRDIVALDKSNPPKLWQQGKLTHTCIRESQTTRQIDVSDSGAYLH